MIEAADRTPLELTLQLEDGPQAVRLDGAKLLLVLLHMMREGEAALVPEAVAALKRGDSRLIKQFAEDLENDDGGLLEQNAQQFGGLFNTIECRETWAAVDQAARERADRGGRRLRPDRPAQQAVGLLSGVARAGGAARPSASRSRPRFRPCC